MRITTNVIALFCEDIREEKNNVFTLIGLFPDNLNFEPEHPSAEENDDAEIRLAKLCVYVRINFASDFPEEAALLELINSDGERIKIGDIPASKFEEAAAKAKSKGNDLAGLITRIVFAGIKVSAAAPLRVEVTLGERKYLAGILNLKLKPGSGVKPTSDSSQAVP